MSQKKQSKITRTELRPIYIEWHDPTSVDGWQSIEKMQLEEPNLIRTFGYLTHETRLCIVVSLNVDVNHNSEGGASCSMIIPKKLISHRQFIKVLERCKPKLQKK